MNVWRRKIAAAYVAEGVPKCEESKLNPVRSGIDINFGNERVHIARLKGSLPSTQTLLKVKGNALLDEKAALKAWLAIRKPDAGEFVFNAPKSIELSRITILKLFREIARTDGLGETT